MSEIIRLENINKYYLSENRQLLDAIFRRKPVYVRALENVNLSIGKNTIVAIVGESGSGKTTIGKIITTIESPTKGTYYFKGEEVKDSNLKNVRKNVSMVFQNPTTSVNPRMKIKDLVSEPLGKLDEKKAREVLNSVGLNYDDFKDKQPRELSGGQIQRVAIARALIKEPEVLILDEPTSALDESIQAQILNLLIDIQKKMGLTFVFITHNIAVARYISDKIAVTYAGKVVEFGKSEEILKNPKHPYTQMLISSVPGFDSKDLKSPVGDVPSLINPPQGCRFKQRCPKAMDICSEEPSEAIRNDTMVLCWLYV